MGKKPTSVLVLSIIGIVWASLNILASCATPVLFALQWNSADPMARVYRDTGFQVFTAISTSLGLLLAIFLLFASIGALRLRAWARTGMIAYGVLFIVLSILSILVNVIYVMPLTKAALAAGAGPGTPDVRMVMMLTQISTICCMVLCFIYPICIFYFFTRPKVVDAFKGIFDAEPTNFPVDYAPYPPQDPPQNPPVA